MIIDISLTPEDYAFIQRTVNESIDEVWALVDELNMRGVHIETAIPARLEKCLLVLDDGLVQG